jgi:hypothetical protein
VALSLVGGQSSEAQDLCAGQVAKLMGNKWKELSDAEKAVRCLRLALCAPPVAKLSSSLQPYVEKYERDKERAACDRQEYQVHWSYPLIIPGF